jgi:membrane protease YdiL (CAAX protease family)
MRKVFEVIALILLAATAIFLIALQIKSLGWVLFLCGIAAVCFSEKAFRKDIILIYISLGILGIAPISTDISPMHMLILGIMLPLAILIPYSISRFVYKDHAVRFPFHHGRNWYKSEIAYVFIAAITTYLFFPAVLSSGNSYLNWTVLPGFLNLSLLFLGTNGLGIWDELFFISTVLALLRRHLSFPLANLLQAILFTSFLYELGFRGFGFLVIFVFALTQGYIFKKTESLLYLITIHLTIDFILYLALISMHHPTWMPIFIR